MVGIVIKLLNSHILVKFPAPLRSYFITYRELF